MRRGNSFGKKDCRTRATMILVVFLVVFFPLQFASAIPHPKKVQLTQETVNLGPESKLIIPDGFKDRYNSSVNSCQDTLSGFSAEKNIITIDVKVLSQAEREGIPKEAAFALSHEEGYWVEVSEKDVRIQASDSSGALHGLTTLEKMLIEGKGKIQQGRILDWPDLKVRALHFLLGTRTPGEIEGLIRSARFGHFNTLIIQLDNRVNLSSMKQIFFSSVMKGKIWTREEFVEVVSYARENGLDVVPELSLLTHQNYLLKDSHPHLMFNWVTYDPRKEETYAVILPMIDEVIELVRPKAFHIGHDEVAGHKPKSLQKLQRMGEKMLPPELFLKDVLRLHGHLKKRGIETWMWGDMLLAPGRFPKMNQKHFHGTKGYGALFDKIPKDIVICDWHYADTAPEFPSALAFAEAGHKVLGSTWRKPETIRNFSIYVANMPFGGEGMIATTWGYLLRNEMDIVQEILDNSAEAFWNAK